MRNILDILNALLEDLKKLLSRMPDLNDELYQAAKASIGKDLSTVADNDVACAEAVSRVVQKAFPELRFPTIVSTQKLFQYLTQSPSFQEVSIHEPGDIIIAVTGMGNGSLPHGHTGIVGKEWIMSNDSRTGTFEANYTFAAWNRYFDVRGGFQSQYFRRV